MNPAGTTTGVKVGLAAALVVTAGVGSAAGVRVARFTTAITDATAMTSATIATVARPRRSHLPEHPRRRRLRLGCDRLRLGGDRLLSGARR